MLFGWAGAIESDRLRAQGAEDPPEAERKTEHADVPLLIKIGRAEDAAA